MIELLGIIFKFSKSFLFTETLNLLLHYLNVIKPFSSEASNLFIMKNNITKGYKMKTITDRHDPHFTYV